MTSKRLINLKLCFGTLSLLLCSSIGYAQLALFHQPPKLPAAGQQLRLVLILPEAKETSRKVTVTLNRDHRLAQLPMSATINEQEQALYYVDVLAPENKLSYSFQVEDAQGGQAQASVKYQLERPCQPSLTLTDDSVVGSKRSGLEYLTALLSRVQGLEQDNRVLDQTIETIKKLKTLPKLRDH